MPSAYPIESDLIRRASDRLWKRKDHGPAREDQHSLIKLASEALRLRAMLAARDVEAASVAFPSASFQGRVAPWMAVTFGPEISADVVERCDRLIEEVFEAAQSKGYARERAAALIPYVWNRPVGDPEQEVGGVMVTLAAFCLAAGIDMHRAGETELLRIWMKVEEIRAKQAAKPTGSALPVAMLAGA